MMPKRRNDSTGSNESDGGGDFTDWSRHSVDPKRPENRDLKTMTEEQLRDRMEELFDADQDEADSVEAFADLQKEIKAIEDELEWRKTQAGAK